MGKCDMVGIQVSSKHFKMVISVCTSAMLQDVMVSKPELLAKNCIYAVCSVSKGMLCINPPTLQEL
jgi:hypothetical protein